VGQAPLELKGDAMRLFRKSLTILKNCVKEAPEFAARRRRLAAGKKQ
jgi:hypothetical protein